MQQHPGQDASMFSYRVDAVEKDVVQIKMQLSQYETTRENDLKQQQSDLKIQTIMNSLADIKSDVAKLRDEMKANITTLSNEMKAIDTRLDQLQIRTLLWFVGWFLSIVAAIFIGYVTHLFH